MMNRVTRTEWRFWRRALVLGALAGAFSACGDASDDPAAEPGLDAQDAVDAVEDVLVADPGPRTPDPGPPPAEDVGPAPDTEPDPPPTGRCSAPPSEPLQPTGPLPAPLQPHRGVDAWERPAYEQLREAVLADPGVHFVAIWDAITDRFVVESGPADARQTLEFRRVVNPGGGGEYEVLAGSVSAMFGDTDAQRYGDYAELLAALENPDGTITAEGYPEGDPRLGVLPEEAQSYPLPLVRLAALFDAPDAPDMIGSLRPYSYPSASTHGAMSLLQSRSTFILSGAGVRSGVVLDEAAILPDVVPTVLAALGAPTTGGVGPDGTYDDGLFLLRQDGAARWSALTAEPCDRAERAMIIDFDGLMATELNHQLLDADAEVDLPTMRGLATSGVVFRYGATTNFPSVSAPGHMTVGTGLWSGHHGFVANAFYQREHHSVLNPFSLLTEIEEVLADPSKAIELYERGVAPGVETLAEATHRALGASAFVAVINEIAVGGADYTSMDYLLGKPPVPPPGASLEKYLLADALAATQVGTLLQNPEVPVPTVLQVSLVATDSAGEAHGPHSDAVREVLLIADGHVATILDAYAARGALEGTVVALVADHGMELQDPTRPSGYAAAVAGSGVKLVQPFPGLVYLRTLRASVDALDGLQATLTVYDHLDSVPLQGADVVCGVCVDFASGVSDVDGVVTVDLSGAPPGPVELAVTHPDFNPQTVLVAPE